MADYSRRNFLKMTTSALLAASGLLGLGGLLRYLGFSTDPPPRNEFVLGLAIDYPLPSRTVLPEVPAVLIHDENGFSALSLTCPHLGCTVNENEAGFLCPCHGSRFAPDGTLQRGPAKDRLPVLRLETRDDGHLHLFLMS
jgi:Rieske Fe-S protein